MSVLSELEILHCLTNVAFERAGLLRSAAMRTRLTIGLAALLAAVLVRCGTGTPNPNNPNNTDAGSTPSGSDTQAPTFAGLASATATGANVALSWTAATDNEDSAAEITYRVFQATTAGGQNFLQPRATTAPGATSYTVNGLATGTHYFVIRAVDSSGNEDGNRVEKSATVATGGNDTTPPSMSGDPTVAAVYADTVASAGQLNVSWAAGTDNVSSAGELKYQLCWSTNATGCATFTAMSTTMAGATSAQITGLTPRTQYYVSVRAQDAAGNNETAVHTATATTATSYSVNILQGIFQTSQAAGGCTQAGCHGGDGWSYAELVNVNIGNVNCTTLLKRILPGDATNSLVYRKMSNATPANCGNVMPPGAGNQNAAKVEAMFDWITQGAKQN
jgi:hypothetical protein